ncbi:MAG: SWIM zinc finger family protein [Kouleothrix sp.]
MTIELAEQSSARLQVRDNKINRSYQVMVWLNARQIALTCTCRENYHWYLCRHRIAAILALHEHLKANPPKLWRAVLEQGAQATRRPSVNYGPIVFSLQTHGSSWSVTPWPGGALFRHPPAWRPGGAGGGDCRARAFGPGAPHPLAD